MKSCRCPFSLNVGAIRVLSDGRIAMLDSVRSQDELGRLVLDVSDAVEMNFSEKARARTGTTGKGEIAQTYADIQPKKSAYGLQTDQENGGILYGDWLDRIRFVFLVRRPGRYYRWQRIYLPSSSGWNHWESMDGQDEKECNLSLLPAKKWFWWKSPHSYELTDGLHYLDLTWLLGGKRIQSVCFTPDPQFMPDETTIASPLSRIDRTVVETSLLQPLTASALESCRFGWDGKGQPPRMKVRTEEGAWREAAPVAGADHGYMEVALGKLSLAKAKAGGLQIQIELIRDEQGVGPSISAPELVYQESADEVYILKSARAELLIHRQTGRLVEARLRDDKDRVHPVMRPFSTMPPPRLFLKAPRQKGHWLEGPEQAGSRVDGAENALKGEYAWLGGKLRVRTLMRAAGEGLFELAAEIENDSEEDVLEFEWPVTPRICPGGDIRRAVLMMPRYEPQLISAPAGKGILNEIYPHGSMNWLDLADGAAGIYLCALDPELVLTRLSSKPAHDQATIALAVAKMHRIRANGGRWTYHYELGIHPGDWHWGADRYRKYFSQRFPPPQYPAWMKMNNGWYEGIFASVERNLPEVQPPAYRTIVEHHIDRAWYLGLDHIQIWGQSAMDHACPTYYLPDPERGGEKDFMAMLAAWRKAGLRFGAYIHPSALSLFYAQAEEIRGIKRDALPEALRPPDWDMLVHNLDYADEEAKPPDPYPRERLEDAKRHNSVIPRDYPKMSDFSRPWRDYIRFWIDRYLREYGISVMYLDQLGTTPQHPEFNPHLGLHGEGDGARRIYDFIRDLHREMTAHNPEFAMIQEAVTDALAVYAAPMTSGFHRNTEVYRYTFPDHCIYFGQGNGGWLEHLLEPITAIAFLEGLKFDIIRIKPCMERIVWLRDSLREWVFGGCYRHNLGVTLAGRQNGEWRCFYTADEANEALLVTLKDIPADTALQWDQERYGKFAGAFFMNTDGDYRSLPIVDQRLVLPACGLGALVLTRKVAEARAFVVQAWPDARAGENGLLHCQALNISGQARALRLELKEHDGPWQQMLETGAVRPGEIWRQSVPLAPPYQKRLLIIPSAGLALRRFVGAIKGTFYGYPNNRKNWLEDYKAQATAENDQKSKT